MLHDFRTDPDLSGLPRKFCIIGAGAAGITLARRLLARGHPVVLLESGGLDYESAIQELAAGTSSGLEYYDLDQVNLRMVGGTTPIWGGRCAELDPIDFEKRDWVPYSGWPIGPQTLDPYYDEAAQVLEIGRPGPGLADLKRRMPALAQLDSSPLAAGCWSFDDRPNRFAWANLGDLAAHPNCWVVTHATVTALKLEGARVAGIQLADIGGNRTEFAPEIVILALGGIETPRLLLNSPGLDRDPVGRFFMEHPHARGGRVEGPAAWQLLEAFGRTHRSAGTRHAALLRLSDAEQRAGRTLNSGLTLGARQAAAARQALAMRTYGAMKHSLEPSRFNRGLWRGLKRVSVWAHERVDPLRPWLLIRSGARELALILRAEQAPNPDSRILLSAERDALGMRRIELSWQLCELDKHSVRLLVGALDRRLKALGMGAVQAEGWLDEPETLWRTDPKISAHPIGGYHHMGTARMSTNPAQGAVDADCRLHGADNAFICGSSVFPTSGWANPTFTILALTLRLADHLDRVSASPMAVQKSVHDDL